ncbi:MAG: PH domain-containing protein [Desulfuromonadaceae bacterium]|jgi:hypothetical protein
MFTWKPHLEEGESLCWEGRPAPRAFVFRNWRHSAFGILLLAVGSYWQFISFPLAEQYQLPWLPLLPLSFLLLALYLVLGHLLLARLEWEQVFYAVTNRRILVRRGWKGRQLIALSRAELTHFRVVPLGEELASIRLNNREGKNRLALIAVEHPQPLIELLEDSLRQNGFEINRVAV